MKVLLHRVLRRALPRGLAGWRTIVSVVIALLSLSGCHRDPCAPLPSGAPWSAPVPIHDGDSVFFVGNSFFGWQDRLLPDWVAALGRAVSPLADFLNDAATREALVSRRYQLFVLQGEELEAVDHKARFHQSVRDFNRAVVAAGGRTVLFMTWDFPWRQVIDKVAASYDEIGRELGIPVIPIGLIYRDCGCHPYAPGMPLHWLIADAEHPKGDLHPNEQGAAVNAYATFEMLTGINPAGRNFAAHGNSNDDRMMQYLAGMSWARVAPRLRAQP
jgi:hypothetical protein